MSNTLYKLNPAKTENFMEEIVHKNKNCESVVSKRMVIETDMMRNRCLPFMMETA